MWLPSPCIFGTLQETKVFDSVVDHSNAKATPSQPGLHGEVAGEDKEVLAEVSAKGRAKVSGQPSVPAIGADGESTLAIAAPDCMAHPKSGCPPHPLQVSLMQKISPCEESWAMLPFNCDYISVSLGGGIMPYDGLSH